LTEKSAVILHIAEDIFAFVTTPIACVIAGKAAHLMIICTVGLVKAKIVPAAAGFA
jgi:hypothetical protein